MKARRIKELGRIIATHGFPSEFGELIKLPGVGRKTANVVLANALKKPAIGVDTHVHRISNRIGVVRTKNPARTEIKLMETVPKELWIQVNRSFVGFGQTVCKPLKPLCGECPICVYCPKVDIS
jgi:endonuclease-3